MKANRGLLLRSGISFVALGALIFGLREKLGASLQLLQGLALEWFGLGVLVYLAALAILSKRLQMILRSQGVQVGFWRALYLTFIGQFFTLFLPSAFGGDVAKAYYAYQYSGKKLGSVTGVFQDRLVGFLSLFPIALTALAIYGSAFAGRFVKESVYGAFGIFLFTTFFFTSQRFARRFGFLVFLIPLSWRQKLSEFYFAIRDYRNHKRTFASCFAISVAAQLVSFWGVYILARSLGLVVSPWPFFVLVPLMGFASLAPSLGGLGVREVSFVFLFQPLMSAEKAGALAIVYDLVFYGVAVAAGVVFAVKGGLRRGMVQDLSQVEELQEV